MAEVSTRGAADRAVVTTEGGRKDSQPMHLWRIVRQWPIVPFIIFGFLVTGAIFAPLIAPHSPTQASLRDRTKPPMWAEGGTVDHILGTDHQGRDILSRVIYGARISLVIAVVAISLSLVAGTALGLVSGYYGGFVDEAIMRFVDLIRSVPFLLIALVFVVVFGQSFALLLLLLSVTAWTGYARQVRAEALQLREREYVQSAKIAGASSVRIIYRHILPGVVSTITVISTLQVGSLILAEASLSFLGAGVPPPTPAWGSMVADGRNYLQRASWISMFPGIAILLTVLAFNFLGDWIRDRFDPRLRQL
jgi:peptide/nickel transport system permease protein